MKQLDPKAVLLFFFNSISGIFVSVFLFYCGWFYYQKWFVGNLNPAYELHPFLLLLSNTWWLILIIIAILGYTWAFLTYRAYKYELREDGFRKEHGVIWKKYVTIPYEKIQNVDIYRGLLARILGLSDLNIQTAGMSSTVGSYGGQSEGRLPGLSPEDAEKLRDELVKRARGAKGSGV